MGKKKVEDLMVVENTALNSTNFIIRVKSNSSLPKFLPGQFVNVEIKGTDNIFLRRPFSVFEVDYNLNTISLIVKILGRGSKKLTEIKIGEPLNLIFPLGNSFTLPLKSDRILLIGGGSGVAPMLFLARESNIKRESVSLLIGAKTAKDHIEVTDYSQFGECYFTTEDGSFGEEGFVTQHPIFKNNLRNFTKIYACGPDGMMKAIAKEAKRANIFCEVSLETLMACGFGVCLCCIEPTVKGNLCVCTEGPVFNVNELKW